MKRNYIRKRYEKLPAHNQLQAFSVVFLISFFTLLVSFLYSEWKKSNHVTIFLSFEPSGKVVSTCMYMASVTWLDPACAFLIRKAGIILGYDAAFISWISHRSVPEGADGRQAYPGKTFRHLASSRVLKRCWVKGKATCGSWIMKEFKILVHL